MATPAKKEKKACKILHKWFLVPEISGKNKSDLNFFTEINSKNMKVSLHCLLCDKSLSIEHQGKLDLQRHCRGNAKRKQGPINTDFLPQGSNIDKQASIAEVKVVGFSAEHNLVFAILDHLGPLFKSIFADSKIAKTYSCGKTKHLLF